jgi:hypothetical protein
MCAARGIECAWRTGDDGELLLRTRERCQAVARHPRTGERVWFSQANLFHLSALDDDMQDALVDAVGLDNVPRNVYYGDGAPLEADALAQIRGVLERQRIVFPWRTGDVLMLDNMLSAHARDPFEGRARWWSRWRRATAPRRQPHGGPMTRSARRARRARTDGGLSRPGRDRRARPVDRGRAA